MKTKSIIKQSTTKDTDKLNILTFPTHERYETNLCQTGYNFYSIRNKYVKDWDTNYAPVPHNYHLLPPSEDIKVNLNYLRYVDFDLVLSQNKFGQYQQAQKYSEILNVPIVSLEHTLPVPNWTPQQFLSSNQMKGHLNVFITQYNQDVWLFDYNENTRVIYHGIDTEIFKPDSSKEKKDVALSVVNDWKNRDWCCGYRIWENSIVKNSIPHEVVGKNPGWTEPESSAESLATRYQTSRVFVNTSLISPIPKALLEAMACGCAVVSTDNCGITEIAENETNMLLANTPEEITKQTQRLMNDKSLCEKLGENARNTVIEKFSMDAFVNNWKDAFNYARKIIL